MQDDGRQGQPRRLRFSFNSSIQVRIYDAHINHYGFMWNWVGGGEVEEAIRKFIYGKLGFIIRKTTNWFLGWNLIKFSFPSRLCWFIWFIAKWCVGLVGGQRGRHSKEQLNWFSGWRSYSFDEIIIVVVIERESNVFTIRNRWRALILKMVFIGMDRMQLNFVIKADWSQYRITIETKYCSKSNVLTQSAPKAVINKLQSVH